MGVDLQALARTVRNHPGVAAKAEIGLVSEVFQSTDWLAGPGDDGAVVTDQGVSLVVGGEAILPSFVAADPYGAGVAAVTTNLNDLAAMGAWPLALVDTVTGPREVIRRVLEGMRWASGLYQVPVVGGHLTVTEGPPGLSAFGLGRADFPLSAQAADARPVADRRLLPGRADAARLPVLPLVRRARREAGRGRPAAGRGRGERLGGGGQGREHGRPGRVAGHAARMQPARGVPGPGRAAGPGRGDGGALDHLLPVPVFPALRAAGREEDCLHAFGLRGLAAATVGTLDDSGLLRIGSAGQTETVFDLSLESVTNLERPSGR